MRRRKYASQRILAVVPVKWTASLLLLIPGTVVAEPELDFHLGSAYVQSAHAQESRAVTIRLTGDAIEAAALSGGTLWLKLTPSGSNQVATATKGNRGNRVTIRVLGHQALSLMVVHELPMEKLVIKAPSPELTAAIEPYLIKTR